jgi:hypothetical protein
VVGKKGVISLGVGRRGRVLWWRNIFFPSKISLCKIDCHLEYCRSWKRILNRRSLIVLCICKTSGSQVVSSLPLARIGINIYGKVDISWSPDALRRALG